MKTCSVCQQEKALECFSKQAKGRFGVTSICKPCTSERGKKWHLDNRERSAAGKRAYAAQNREAISASQREWRRKNAERLKAQAAKWTAENADRKRAATAKRGPCGEGSSAVGSDGRHQALLYVGRQT